MSVVANGRGPSEKARITVKRPPVPKPEGNSVALSVVGQSDEETIDAKDYSLPRNALLMDGSHRSVVRLERLIMEAITKLKEADGSYRTRIAIYIEDLYWATPNFKRLMSGKLNHLTSGGKLIKVKRIYQILQPSVTEEERLLQYYRMDGRDFPQCTRHINLELAEMKGMTTEEATAAATRAVAEAEVATKAAEEAAREAEAAEAGAPAA